MDSSKCRIECVRDGVKLKIDDWFWSLSTLLCVHGMSALFLVVTWQLFVLCITFMWGGHDLTWPVTNKT